MNVHIRPLEERDAYVSVNWRNDPEVFKYTGNTYNQIITLESELQWIRKVINNADEKRFAILVDEKYIGNIYLTNINNGRARYHIFIGNKDFWGKGVAKKASLQIIKFGFEKLGLNEIELKVKPSNERALRLYYSLGFEEIEKDNNFITMIKKNSTK